MAKLDEVVTELKGVGISEHDALVIADCIVTRKSCSWINTDEVNEKMLRDLKDLIEKHDYRIDIVVQPVHTRDKFIWEVKVLS